MDAMTQTRERSIQWRAAWKRFESANDALSAEEMSKVEKAINALALGEKREIQGGVSLHSLMMAKPAENPVDSHLEEAARLLKGARLLMEHHERRIADLEAENAALNARIEGLQLKREQSRGKRRAITTKIKRRNGDDS
jgi:hypothetical protein